MPPWQANKKKIFAGFLRCKGYLEAAAREDRGSGGLAGLRRSGRVLASRIAARRTHQPGEPTYTPR
jgi:hypothetical protein